MCEVSVDATERSIYDHEIRPLLPDLCFLNIHPLLIIAILVRHVGGGECSR
jgi:hypothetical protein